MHTILWVGGDRSYAEKSTKILKNDPQTPQTVEDLF